MGINLSTIKTIAKYAETSGVKSILQTKPIKLSENAFKGLKLAPLEKDVFPSPIGKHKIPRFLYHLTNAENYKSILKDGKIKPNILMSEPQGVFMIELNNFFKHWSNQFSKFNNSSSMSDLKIDLINQVKKESNKIVLLKIPTSNLEKQKLIIRSQNRLFTPMPFNSGKQVWSEWNENRFSGYPVEKSNLFNQRKEAIEYVFKGDIEGQKIGEFDFDKTLGDQVSIKTIFSQLLRGQPEEKALVNINLNPSLQI